MKALVLCFLLTAGTGDISYAADSKNDTEGVQSDYISTKIVGGEDVTPGELPYQVSLFITSGGILYHICGGSIISQYWILTAAHCVVAMPPFVSPIKIVAGQYSLEGNDGTEQIVGISEIHVNKAFDILTAANDIALLELDSPIHYNQYSQPIALPPTDHKASGDCVISGWGLTKEDGNSPDILQKATVAILSDDKCVDVSGEGKIVDGMICAGVVKGGIGSCQGDSGGPLACNDIGYSYLAGVVSFGQGCARPGYPGVYTNVSYYVDWINETSGKASNNQLFLPFLLLLPLIVYSIEP